MSYTTRAASLLAALLLAACRGATTDTFSPRGAGPSSSAVELVRTAARPITGAANDYDPLLALVGDARAVLLGEQTHGTHEFYAERARITQRLVAERGFTAVAIEGDWPDAWRVNAYIRGLGTDGSPEEALASFTRFPQWMWRNEEVRDLVRWLRDFNATRPESQRVGLYGLDVYSLYPSIDEVLAYLDRADPAAVARVRTFYRCFERHRPDPQAYGSATRGGGTSCEAQARDAVRELEARPRPSDAVEAEALFSALRNAHSVANAESYFRTLYTGGMSTWNLRDQRMAETLEAIEGHLREATGAPARVVIWAHNTHTGDARMTEQGQAGELNIGQLVRQRHGTASALVGFFTYEGEVMAATDWDRPGQVRTLRPALPESYGALFHASGVGDFLLLLRGGGPVAEELARPRLERAVGVVYAPETERQSHYFTSQLGTRFDAAIFFDRTTAVRPLR